MSTPPLSPTPRRWAPSGSSPLVDALTSLADSDSSDLLDAIASARASTNASSSSASGGGSIRNSSLLSPQARGVPSIKTTSPSPQRNSNDNSNSTNEGPSSPSPLVPQQTGGSLAAVYDDVYASIDAFANQTFTLPPIPSVRGGPSSPSLMSPPRTPRSPSRSNASPISPLSLTPPPSSPTTSRRGGSSSPVSGLASRLSSGAGSFGGSLGASTSRSPRRPPLNRATSADTLHGLGINMPRSPSAESTGSKGSTRAPSGPGSGLGSVEMLRTESNASTATSLSLPLGTAVTSFSLPLSQATPSEMGMSGRYPSVSKSPLVSPTTTGSGSGPSGGAAPVSPRRSGAAPGRASDLIKMFESRAEPTTPSSTLPLRITKAAAAKADDKPLPSVPSSSSSGVSSIPPPAPPRDPQPEPTPPQDKVPPPAPEPVRLPSPVSVLAPAQPAQTPPPKAKTPVSNFRNVIASWRARTASEADKPEPDVPGSASGLRRDRAWNVSIRRKRNNDTGAAFAEQASEESSTHYPDTPSPIVTMESLGSAGQRTTPVDERDSHVEPHYSGPPIRTGTLYYFNVHESDEPSDFFWVQVDAQLYNEGLHIRWRTESDAEAVINFDLAFCEEAASMYSPNDQHSGDDIGAVVARRQGDLASILCPFQLVFDDGVERFACDSARERVAWVRALWGVLENLRLDARHMRPPPSVHSKMSIGSGSASARYSSHRARSIISDSSFPTQTVDDAVVVTGGGFAAPLTSRNSRKLAASSSLTRDRSIRRVASDINLREPEPMSEPLTRDNAKRITMRDFSFAQKSRSRGISPPPLPSDITPTQASNAYVTAVPSMNFSTTPTMKDKDRFTGVSSPTPQEYQSAFRQPYGLPSPVPSTFTFGTPGLYPQDSVSNIYVHPKRGSTPRAPSPRKEQPPPQQLPTITGSTNSTHSTNSGGLPVQQTDSRAIVTPSTALSMHTAPTAPTENTTSFQTARQLFESDASGVNTGSSGSSTAQAIQTLRNVPASGSATGQTTFSTAHGSVQPSAVTAPSTMDPTAVTAPSTMVPTAVTAPEPKASVVPAPSTAPAVTALSTTAQTAVTAPSTVELSAVTAPSTVVPSAVTAPSTQVPTAVTAPSTLGPSAVTAPSTLAPTAVTASQIPLNLSLPRNPNSPPPLSPTPSTLTRSPAGRSVLSLRTALRGGPDAQSPRSSAVPSLADPSGFLRSVSPTASVSSRISTRSDPDRPRYTLYDPPVPQSPNTTNPSDGSSGFVSAIQGASTPSSGNSYATAQSGRRGSDSPMKQMYAPVAMSRSSTVPGTSGVGSDFVTAASAATASTQPYTQARGPESTLAPTSYITTRAPTEYGSAGVPTPPTEYKTASLASDYKTAPPPSDTTRGPTDYFNSRPLPSPGIPVTPGLTSDYTSPPPASTVSSNFSAAGSETPGATFRPGVFSDVGLSTTGAITTVSMAPPPLSTIPSSSGTSTPTPSLYLSAPPIPISKSSQYPESSVGSAVSSFVASPNHPAMPSAPPSTFLPSEFPAPSTLAPPATSYVPSVSEYSSAPPIPPSTKYAHSAVSAPSTYSPSEVAAPSVPPVSRGLPSEVSSVPPSKYSHPASVSNYGPVPSAVGSPIPSSVPPSTVYYATPPSTAPAPTEYTSTASTLARYVMAPSHLSPTEYSSVPPSSMAKYATASSASGGSSYASPRSPGTQVSVYSTASSQPMTLASMMSSEMEISGRSATPVSEPDTDLAMLAGLERQSSAGSYASAKRSIRQMDVRDLGDRTYVTFRDAPPQRGPPASTGTSTPKARSVAAPPSVAGSSSNYATPQSTPGGTSSTATPHKLHRKAVPALDPTPQPRAMPVPPAPRTGPPAGAPPSGGSSSSSSSSSKTWVPPQRPNSTPPSRHSSSASSSTRSSRSTSTSYESNRSTSTTHPRDQRDYSMLRLLNYIQGQEQVRQGQTTRMGTQMDRIEHKVDRLERMEGKLLKYEKNFGRLEKMDEKLDQLKELANRRPTPIRRGMSLSSLSSVPPPLPSKDGHSVRDSDSEISDISDTETERSPSPALSDSSSCSADTERPVTPTLPPGPVPFIVPDSLNNRLDDFATLFGTLLAHQRDIMAQQQDMAAQIAELKAGGSRSLYFDSPLPDPSIPLGSIPSTPRSGANASYIEEMLRRILYHVGGAPMPPTVTSAPASVPPSIRSLPDPGTAPDTVRSVPGPLPSTPGSVHPTPSQQTRGLTPSPFATPRQPMTEPHAAPVPPAPRSVAGSVDESVIGSDAEGPFYPGSSSVYGSEIAFNGRIPPPNSEVAGSPTMSAVLPESLLNGGIEHEPFNYEYATADLPPATPPPPQPRNRDIPEWLRERQRLHAQAQAQADAEARARAAELAAAGHALEPEITPAPAASEYHPGDYHEDYEGQVPYDEADYPDYQQYNYPADDRDTTPQQTAGSPAQDGAVTPALTVSTMKPTPPTPKTPAPPTPKTPAGDNIAEYSDPTRELDDEAGPAFPNHNPLGLPTPVAVDLPTPVNDKRHLPRPAHSTAGTQTAVPPPGSVPPTPGYPYAPSYAPSYAGSYAPGNYGRARMNRGRSPMTNSFVRGGFRRQVGTPGLGFGGLSGQYPGLPGSAPPMPSVREEDDGDYLSSNQNTPKATPKATPKVTRAADLASAPNTPKSRQGSHTTPHLSGGTVDGEATPALSQHATVTASPASDERILTPIQINVQAPSESDHSSHHGTPLQTPGQTPLQTPLQTPIHETRDLAAASEKGTPAVNAGPLPNTPGSDYWNARLFGEQQNDMARYLHEWHDEMNERQEVLSAELREVLSKLDDLRSNVRRETVYGRVLADGRVQLATGEIVEGIRGVPEPGVLPPSPDPSNEDAVPTIPGKILPDGTVLAGEKIVKGITGDAFTAHASESDLRELIQKKRDEEQDKKLEDLQEHVSELISAVDPDGHSAHSVRDTGGKTPSRATSRLSQHSQANVAPSRHSATPAPSSHHTLTPSHHPSQRSYTPSQHSRAPSPSPSSHHTTPGLTPHGAQTELASPASVHTNLATPHATHEYLTPASAHVHIEQTAGASGPRSVAGSATPEAPITVLGNVATEKPPAKVWSTNSSHPSRRGSPEPKSGKSSKKGSAKGDDDDEIKTYGNVATEYSTNTARNTPKVPEFHLPGAIKDLASGIGGILKSSGSRSGSPGSEGGADKDDEPVTSNSNVATRDVEPSKSDKAESKQPTPVTRTLQLPKVASRQPTPVTNTVPLPETTPAPSEASKTPTPAPSEAGNQPTPAATPVVAKSPLPSIPSPATPEAPARSLSDGPTETPAADSEPPKSDGPSTPNKKGNNVAFVADAPEKKGEPAGEKKGDGKQKGKEKPATELSNVPNEAAPGPSAPAADPLADLIKPVPEDEIPVYELVTLPNGQQAMVKTGTMPKPKPPPTPPAAPASLSTSESAPADESSPKASSGKLPSKAPTAAGTPVSKTADLPEAGHSGGKSGKTTPSATPASKTTALPSDEPTPGTPAGASLGRSDSVKSVSFPGAGSLVATNPDKTPATTPGATSAATPAATPAGGNKSTPLPPTPAEKPAGTLSSTGSRRKPVPKNPEITALSNVPADDAPTDAAPAADAPTTPATTAAALPVDVPAGSGTDGGKGKGKATPPAASAAGSHAPSCPAGPSGEKADDKGDKPADPAAPGVSAAALHAAHCSHCCPNDARPGLVPPVVALADEPKPEEPKKDEPKKDEQKKDEPKKDEPPKKPALPAVPAAPPTPAATSAPPPPAEAAPEPHTEAAPAAEKPAEKPAEVTKQPSQKGKKKDDAAKADGKDKPETTVADPAKDEEAAAKKEAEEKKKAEEEEAKKKEEEEKKKAEEERKKREAELVEAIMIIKTRLDDLAQDTKEIKEIVTAGKDEKEERRKINAERDKKVADALEAILKYCDEDKKGSEEGFDGIKKAFAQANEEMNKNLGERNVDLVGQISAKLEQTKDESNLAKKEQIAFNLQNYLDDFSKALAPEVRTLLKEVGDLRECRRALYVELAELLLMKGRQSAGDLLAIMPYPTKPPPKAEPKKDGGGQPKQPQAPPAWSTFQMPAPVIGAQRPLPNLPPGMPMPMPFGGMPAFNLGGAPPPPGAAAPERPVPKV